MNTYTDIAKTSLNNNKGDLPRLRRRLASVLETVALIGIMAFGLATHASAQTYGPTTCWVSPNGGNGCMSPQYRSGAAGGAYNANLSGSPRGDNKVINSGNVDKLTLLTSIPSPWVAQQGYMEGGCQPSSSGTGLLPTASVSVESRILFPALDSTGNCALFTYDVTFPSDAQFISELTPNNPHVTSSPGYNGNVVIAAEDGNVYAYNFASETLAWTYSSPNPIDASPTTWPNLDGIYVIDNGGVISKINPYTGTLDSTWRHSGGPIFSSVIPGGATRGSVSASSVAVSTGLSTLFVAGSYGYFDGIVQAYNSATGNPVPLWTNDTLPAPVTSSPVVNDSQGGLVYVQTTVSCPQYSNNGGWSNGLIYALDATSGTVSWYASPPTDQPYPFCTNTRGSMLSGHLPPVALGDNVYSSGGSPAYDETNKYVIATANVSYVIGTLGQTTSSFVDSILAVYNAQSFASGGGTLVCSATITHPINQSSPEVVDGVIYIGTDDGYVLAYDEITCSPKWQSTPILKSDGITPDPVLGPPVVSYNRVHVVTESGALYVWHQLGH